MGEVRNVACLRWSLHRDSVSIHISKYCGMLREQEVKYQILTPGSAGFCSGNVSTGLIQATPGEIKSFRSSAERIALIVVTDNPTRGSKMYYWRWEQDFFGRGNDSNVHWRRQKANTIQMLSSLNIDWMV